MLTIWPSHSSLSTNFLTLPQALYPDDIASIQRVKGMTGCPPDAIAVRTVASRNIVLATGTARGLEWLASLNNRFRRLLNESRLQPACNVEAHVTDARPRNLPNVARPLHPRRHGSRAPGSQPSINEAHSEKSERVVVPTHIASPLRRLKDLQLGLTHAASKWESSFSGTWVSRLTHQVSSLESGWLIMEIRTHSY